MPNRNLALTLGSLLLAILLVAGFPTGSKTDASQPSVSPLRLDPQPVSHGIANVVSRASSAATRSADSLSLNVARRNHTATALADGRVVIIGGDNENGVIGEVEVLDASAKTVAITARLLVARTQHTATLLEDGRVLVSGGFDNNGALNSTEVFDPKTGGFSGGPSLQKARAGHSATVLENGKVLIAGGQEDRSVEIYDPATNQTTLLHAKTSAIRAAHSAARLNDGSVLLAGGAGVAGHNLESAEVFDTNTLTFHETAKPMMIRRTRPDLRVLPDGKVQVIGGDYDGTMEMYDPATDRFSAAVHLVPTSDIFPVQQMLSAQTRGGFVDAVGYSNPKIERQSTQSVADRVTSLKESVWRSQYAAAEIASLQKAVIVGGADDDQKAMNSVLLLSSSSATVSTDQVVYFPGKPPVITGTGWKPFERVTIVRQEGRLPHQRITLQAVANAKGKFVTELTAADYHAWVTYSLTARGESSNQVAQTAYDDAPPPGKERESFTSAIKFEIPLTRRDASVELEGGLLRWNVTAPVKDSPSTNTCTPVSGADFDFGTTFPTIVGQPCLAIPGNPCGSSSIQLTEGCFEMSGNFIVEGCALGDGCPFLKLALDQKFTAHAVFDLSLQGSLSFEQKLFDIPGVGVSFHFGDILQGEAGVQVKAKLEINATTPTNLQPSFDLTEGYEIGFDSRHTPAFYTMEHTAAAATAAVNLTLLGSSDAKLKIGPELSFSLTAFEGSSKPQSIKSPDFEIGSASFGVFPFLQAIITPTQATGSCKAGTVNLKAGVDVDAGFDVASVLVVNPPSVSLFDPIQIPGFPKSFFFGTDTTAPTFSNVSNILTSTAPGTCASGPVTIAPTITDDCSGVDLSTLVISPASGTNFPKGVTTVNISVKDNAGNLASTSLTVTVIDQQPPTFTFCPANIIHGTDNNQCGAVVTFAPTATDNCDGSVVPICSPASNSTFNKGVTTVNCVAFDSDHNETPTGCIFTVTVNDTQKPNLILPANVVKSTDPNQCQAVVGYTVSATDNCGTVTPTCAPASGSTFQKGTTTVFCSVTDSSGNGTTGSFTVTINDNQAPSVTCAAGITKPTDPNLCSTSVTYAAATATDNCPGVGTPVCAPASGSTFQKGVTTITCSVRDASNNPGACAFTVTVIDTQKPTIACPATVTVNTEPGLCSAHVTYAAPAVSDNCPGVGAPICSPTSGSIFPKGTTTIACSVTDASSNQSNCAFSVTVVDREAPKIACPPTVSIVATSSCPFPMVRTLTFPAPTASDNCPGVVTVCNPPAGSVVPIGTTMVTCTSTDTSANTTQCTFAVHVFSFCLQDESNPANFVFINAGTGDYEFYCGGVLLASGTGVPSNRGCIESIDHVKGDRRVHILFDTTGQSGRGAGTATLQLGPNNTKCQVTDNNMSDNSCSVHPTSFDGK